MMLKFTLFGPICLLLTSLGGTLSASATEMADLVQALKSNDSEKIELAIEKIADQGPDATQAVPALTTLLSSKYAKIRAHAAHCLGHIGKPAMPAASELAKLITDDDPRVRHAALEALAEIEPGRELVVPLLTTALSDQDPRVIRRALHALADRGAPIVPAMVEALKNDQTEYWALLVLQEIGPEAKDAVPEIMTVLSEPDEPWQRMEACITLGKIGPASAPAVPHHTSR